jgi:hypothetical protein
MYWNCKHWNDWASALVNSFFFRYRHIIAPSGNTSNGHIYSQLFNLSRQDGVVSNFGIRGIFKSTVWYWLWNWELGWIIKTGTLSYLRYLNVCRFKHPTSVFFFFKAGSLACRALAPVVWDHQGVPNWSCPTGKTPWTPFNFS